MPIEYHIPLTGIKVSTNKIYAGTHWSKRKSAKDGIASFAAVFCRPVQKIKSYPVEIHYKFFFASRPLDTLNTAVMAKCFEDALRSLGILEDDDPKHVAKTSLEVIAISRQKESAQADAHRHENYAPNEDHLILTIKSYAK
jgi:hypothetical protein